MERSRVFRGISWYLGVYDGYLVEFRVHTDLGRIKRDSRGIILDLFGIYQANSLFH
jgi:hypothetical protein